MNGLKNENQTNIPEQAKLNSLKTISTLSVLELLLPFSSSFTSFFLETLFPFWAVLCDWKHLSGSSRCQVQL
jgi:hypothetical protein